MKQNILYEIPLPERELIVRLHRLDEETNGFPVVAFEDLDLAKEWLGQILVGARELIAHTRLLETLYRAEFRPPLPRGLTEGQSQRGAHADGFRHAHYPGGEVVRELIENGLATCPPDRLACLLLDPLALWDVADLIGHTLPDHWLPRMDLAGRELVEKHGIDVSLPGVDYFPPRADSHRR